MHARSVSRALAFALSAALVVACSNEETPPDGTPQACTSTVDCPSGQACKDKQCVTLPCDGRCTDNQACVNNQCKQADGLDCRASSSICPKGYLCAADGACHRNCAGDEDCTTAGFRSCNPEAGFCGECTFGSDCADPAKRFCLGALAQCVGCVDNSSCLVEGSPAGKYCDEETRTCKPGCTTVNDCPSGQRCEGAAGSTPGRCVECKPATEGTDCAPHNPRLQCDPQSLQCVECLANADCTSNQCNTARKTCVICVQNEVCQKGYICDQEINDCVPGCAGGNGGANCPTANPRLPVCDATKGEHGTCVECLKDADCPRAQVCQPGATANDLPRCVDGCLASNGQENQARCAATAGANPPETNTICDGTKGTGGRGKCVECKAAGDCGTTETCDFATGMCRCKKEGESCTTSAECGYKVVGNQTYCGGEGWSGANKPVCVKQVRCDGTNIRNVTGVCGIPSTGSEGGSTGCPSQDYVTQWASDGVAAFGKQCVPNRSPYKCQ